MSLLPDRVLDHLRQVTEQPDLTGSRYRLEAELGRGGMGVVYRVWDAQLSRLVALKVMHEGSGYGPTALEEARLLAQLEHPGLVPVYDAGTLPDGRFFYTMRLVEGQRLDRYLAAASHLLSNRLRLFQKLCEAAAYAHSVGIIHCDLKPQNVMIGRFGEVFVMDWGAATGHAMGTPPYMAPEQTEGAVDARTDVYALGRLLLDVLQDSPPRPLLAISRRAMDPEPEPADRYPGAAELSHDLGCFLDRLPVSAYRENAWERTARFAGRNQVLLLLLAAYVAVRFALFFLRQL